MRNTLNGTPFSFLLQIVPLDLVGFQMEVKAGGIGVDGGILGHIGVVDHAVLAVGHKGIEIIMVQLMQNTSASITQVQSRFRAEIH